MVGKLVLFFVAVPLLDMFLLLKVAEAIGLLETVGVVVVTGVIGGLLAKDQGVRTMKRIRARLTRGETPSRELLDGGMVLVGGALLVTPGLVTDIAGFMMLLPATRPLIGGAVLRLIEREVQRDNVRMDRL